MVAVVSTKRARSTGLTALAGLVVLAAAVMMMACAAPRGHAGRPPGRRRCPAASWRPGSLSLALGTRAP